MKKFDLELVIYDEVQYFRPSSDENFDYPWIARKVNLEQFKSHFSKEDDYEFNRIRIKFQKSAACLEDPFYR